MIEIAIFLKDFLKQNLESYVNNQSRQNKVLIEGEKLKMLDDIFANLESIDFK